MVCHFMTNMIVTYVNIMLTKYANVCSNSTYMYNVRVIFQVEPVITKWTQMCYFRYIMPCIKKNYAIFVDKTAYLSS